MDYSAVASDTSPWGSSSPQASRSGFSEASEPDSPTPARHSHTYSQDSLSGSTINPEAASGTAGVDTSPVQRHPIDSQQQASADQSQDGSPDENRLTSSGQGQEQYNSQQYNVQQQGQRPGAARYHSNRQQRPVPQYKLQAKVTALERTGRKDPVLRFDVYVRFCG